MIPFPGLLTIGIVETLARVRADEKHAAAGAFAAQDLGGARDEAAAGHLPGLGQDRDRDGSTGAGRNLVEHGSQVVESGGQLRRDRVLAMFQAADVLAAKAGFSCWIDGVLEGHAEFREGLLELLAKRQDHFWCDNDLKGIKG